MKIMDFMQLNFRCEIAKVFTFLSSFVQAEGVLQREEQTICINSDCKLHLGVRHR